MSDIIVVPFIPDRYWSRDSGAQFCLTGLTYSELVQRKKSIMGNTNRNTKQQQYSNMANGKRFFKNVATCPFKIDSINQ